MPTSTIINPAAYEVVYVNNINPGKNTASIIVRGKGSISLDNSAIVTDDIDTVYTGDDLYTTFKIKYAVTIELSESYTLDHVYSAEETAIPLDDVDVIVKGKASQEVITDHSKLIYLWKKINEQDDRYSIIPPVDVNNYNLRITTNVENDDLYTGTTKLIGDYNFSISPKGIDINAGTEIISKVYDGTVSCERTIVAQNLEYSGLYARDIDGIVCYIGTTDFYTKDVHQENNLSQLTIHGTRSFNYTLNNYTVVLPYEITPRQTTLKNVTAINRTYEQGNYYVEMNDPEFDNLVEGENLVRDSDYEITAGRIPSDEPGNYKARYNVNLYNSNYVFPNNKKVLSGVASVEISPELYGNTFMKGNLFKQNNIYYKQLIKASNKLSSSSENDTSLKQVNDQQANIVATGDNSCIVMFIIAVFSLLMSVLFICKPRIS